MDDDLSLEKHIRWKKIMNEKLISLFSKMIRIRLVEETISRLYHEMGFRCPVHLCIGQEAIATGVCESLMKKDYVLSMHRSHGHYLAKGGNLQRMFAELAGKVTGCCKGKGGSMHLIDKEAGFLGSTSIVSGTIPVAVGTAFASKLKNQDNVTVTFFGDAAVEEGVFHESVNFAVLHNLPVIFVCENNLYSVYSPYDIRQPDREIYSMVKGYGIHSCKCDGNDVVAVYKLMEELVDRARQGGGPAFVEFSTYRWLEHCGPNYDNDLGYRKPGELDAWKEKCPVTRMKNRLIEEQVLTEEMVTAIVDEINQEIEQAVIFTNESPFPEADQVFQHIYSIVGD